MRALEHERDRAVGDAQLAVEATRDAAASERQQQKLAAQLKAHAAELHATKERLSRSESACSGMVSAEELESARAQLHEQTEATRGEAAAREAAEEALRRQQATHAHRSDEMQATLWVTL